MNDRERKSQSSQISENTFLGKKKLHYRKKMPFFLDHIIIRAAAFCSAIMNGFVSNLRRPRRELELQGGKGERLHSCFE